MRVYKIKITKFKITVLLQGCKEGWVMGNNMPPQKLVLLILTRVAQSGT